MMTQMAMEKRRKRRGRKAFSGLRGLPTVKGLYLKAEGGGRCVREGGGVWCKRGESGGGSRGGSGQTPELKRSSRGQPLGRGGQGAAGTLVHQSREEERWRQGRRGRRRLGGSVVAEGGTGRSRGEGAETGVERGRAR
jgi:hypothetical protein